MQAWLRCTSGIRANSSALKLTWVHQHGGCFSPVSRSISIAHWFPCPHKGHTCGWSGAELESEVMVLRSVATSPEKDEPYCCRN
jgi:hypothetical protein